MASCSRIYTQIVMVLRLLFASFAVMSASAQSPAEQPPRFEDFPVKEIFRGKPVPPILETPEERKLEALISDGVSKGWGVFNGETGKELRRAGPNFAGHYVLVSFGCGEPFGACSGAAIVVAKTGSVYQATAPDPESALHLPYFGVFAEQGGLYPPHSFHNFPLRSHLAYRLNSRLLVADICERMVVEGGSIIDFRAVGCGAHYYLMGGDGLTLIRRIAWDPPLKPTACDLPSTCK